MNKLFTLALATTLSFSACSGGAKTSTASSAGATIEPEQGQSLKPIPFSADSAYQYLAYQVELGVRTPQSEAHRQTGDWIGNKLRAWGYQVSEHHFAGLDYWGASVPGRNIIARSNPEAVRRILLVAHWDTRPVADHDAEPSKRRQAILGADDGASGVGVLLELARWWSNKEGGSLGIDFVFFDLEDGGSSERGDASWCQGSRAWARATKGDAVKPDYAILLDMVGAKGAKFYWEYHSARYAKPLMRELWATARELGYSSYFISRAGGAALDDHIPLIEERGIPSVDIINQSPEGNFGAHWHTQADNLSVIDKETLRAVGETVGTTIARLYLSAGE